MGKRTVSEQTKKKLSEANRGQIHWMKVKTHSEESRKKISESRKGHIVTKLTRQKISFTLKGHTTSEERRRKISETLTGRKVSEEARNNIAKAHIGMKRSREACQRMSEVRMGIKLSEETKKRMSEAKRRDFQDPSYCLRMKSAWGMKPTRPEILLLGILEELYPGEWKYTGDFSFIVNGKNPDFVNCNGQKKVIELFGDYWHKGDDPQDRVDIFAPSGYKTLVIWERELKDMAAVASRLKQFAEV